MNTDKELREEWYKCFEGDRKDIPPIMEKCADFWIAVIREIETERAVQCADHEKQARAEEKQKIIEDIKQDIQSVLSMLDGDTDRKKIANYIREYLIKEIQ